MKIKDFTTFTKVKAIPAAGLVSDLEDCQGLLTGLTIKKFVPDNKKLTKESTKQFYAQRTVDGIIEEARCSFNIGTNFVSFYFYSNFKHLMKVANVKPADLLSGKCMARVIKGKLELMGALTSGAGAAEQEPEQVAETEEEF